MVYRRTRRFGKRKRWYFNAGANLPFIGKTNVAFGSGRKKTKQRRAVEAIARKVIRSTVEPKRFLFSVNGKNDCAQNTLYTHNVTELVVKGTDDQNRIGERIHLKNLLINFNLLSLNGEGTTWNSYVKQARVLVVKSRKEYSTSYFDSGFGSTEIFESANVNHFMNGPLLKENVHVISDKLVTFRKPTDDWAYTVTGLDFAINAPLNCTFQYNDVSTSTQGKDWNLFIIFIPHVKGGTTAQSMEMELNMHYHLNFCDTK